MIHEPLHSRPGATDERGQHGMGRAGAAAWRTTRLRTVRSTGARARQGGGKTTRASAAKRATRTERAGEAARERACRGARGAKPLGVIMTVIAHYNVLERLGESATGELFRARDTKVGRTVALKFISAEMFPDSSSRSTFFEQARAAMALSHPNIATLFDVGEYEGDC